MECITIGVKGNERARRLPYKDSCALSIENIITFVKRIVKSKGADENSEGGFSQKVAGTLGIESIITVAKRIVIFRE